MSSRVPSAPDSRPGGPGPAAASTPSQPGSPSASGADSGRLEDLLRRRRLHRRAVASSHPLRSAVRSGLIGFALLTTVGTGLLMLPAASASGHSAPARTALFTATSAASVTGLRVVDTGTYWSGFGHVVLLLLIQCGGIGVMTFASTLSVLVSGRLGLRSRLLALGETRTLDCATLRRVFLGVVKLTLAIESVVFVVLFLRWWWGHGQPVGRAAWWAAFQTVAAVGNCGFTLWPDGLARWAGDPWLMGPLACAVVLGGLGYPVLLELRRTLRPARWSLHTKLTLVTTAALVVAGPVLVWLTEHENPATIGHQGVGGELMSSTFAGVTARSAGFSPFDYGQARPATLLVVVMLMFVGGAAASTAGGIKVSTLSVLVLAVGAEVRGSNDVTAFGRRISGATVRQALAVALIAAGTLSASAIVLLELAPLAVEDAMVEVTAALTTTGLSTGVTASLPAAGQLLLVALMALGRLGPVAMASALALHQGPRAFRYPESRPVVG